MKLIAKIILSIVAIYIALWIAVAVYFNFAERHKGLLESNLSSLFGRDVVINSIQTEWQGFAPKFEINGFKVLGDTSTQAALSFQNLTAKVDPLSVLLFWPTFTQFTIEQPEVEIVNLQSGLLQIAGIELKSNQSIGLNPKRIISWLLDNENASWRNGSVVWRRLNGEIESFEDISFDYNREQETRRVTATVDLPEGTLAFNALSNGDVINSSDWDASLEILGGQGESYLGSDDLSLTVSDGKGQLLLKSLSVQKIRDFLQLTGIGGTQNWLIKSEISGELSNAQFNFSGPLLDFYDWSLKADATAVGFKSTANLPAMNNLNGSIEVSSSGGIFNFTTQEAEFSWQRWFEQPFPISNASGKFEWDLTEDDKINIQLKDGIFSDQVANIRNLNASLDIITDQSRITNFADLFKAPSIQDLSFEAGEVVSQVNSNPFSGPVFLDASAEFDVPDVSLIDRYFPIDPRIAKFRTWWENAIVTGSATDGRVSYQGALTKTALYDGGATLNGKANYQDVVLDYGYERDWPVLSKGKGIVQIDNATLSFLSEQGWIEDDQLEQATVAIKSIFRNDRSLEIDASMQSNVTTVMDFLLDGPLLKINSAADQKPALPISSEGGLVDADVQISIPLNNLKLAKVTGAAVVNNGQLTLPQGVTVTNINGSVNFTENSAVSEDINAEFLGGAVTANLTTTEAAQPPVLRLEAQGTANVVDLKPWIGEHLLSWFDGVTDWQGAILIDGPSANISASSNLEGIVVTAPAPLAKSTLESLPMDFEMAVGKDIEQSLSVTLGDDMYAQFTGDINKGNQFLDKSIISLGGDRSIKDGVNFDINYDDINLDDWLEAIIKLSQIELADKTNTIFLDSMRSLKLNSADPTLLGRKFGAMQLSAVSSDGGNWIGSISGENVDGVIQADPRAEIGNYRLNLSKLYIPEGPKEKPELDPIDNSLSPDKYPIIDLNVNSFRFVRKQLGHLQMRGEPVENAWKLTKFELNHQGVSTKAEGQWVNTPETGTITSFDIETVIDEAGGALQELDMGGFVSKGEGSLKANINWIGAPHEFDYSRLNGDFDLRVEDGELVKIEPGTGKLLGLLNFNAIARRLTLDFSDVFSSGLEFDRMRYAGVFADGEAIMRQAYIFTPAVFVNMQGKLDLDNELIDMEIHLSPELGGNLTLLSALANPAAGALVFLTQQLFKDEMRSASYKSYRALGSWEDFEMVEFDVNDERAIN